MGSIDEHPYPSTCTSLPDIGTLDELIAELHSIFSDDDVDIEYVRAVMNSYQSNRTEWSKFAKWDPHRSYTRNLVDSGNGKFNLMILCWNEGEGSSIHDHANSHCFMKCVEGGLAEDRYEWPSDDTSDTSGGGHMKQVGRSYLKLNDTAYIHDKLGLHRVENPSHSNRAASLHLYSPPYAQCGTFDERTGHKRTCKVTFYTKYGKKTAPTIESMTDTQEQN